MQKLVPDPFNRPSKPLPTAVIHGTDVWVVEYILEERNRGRKQEFKVKWKAYPATEFTWQGEKTLKADLGEDVFNELVNKFSDKRDAAVSVAHAMPASTVARPVYVTSHVLKPYEENYGILELEMAGVVWAILNPQRYLDGAIFTVVTDHQSILSVTTSSTNTIYSTRVDTWRMLLSPYIGQMTMVHNAGKLPTNADGLSRLRRNESGG